MHTYIHKNFIKMMTKRIKLTVNIYVDVFVSCLAMTVALCGWADLMASSRTLAVQYLLLVWQAPLEVRSAKRRHQSPEWTILSHSYRPIQGEIVRPQVLLDSLHPCSSRTSWSSMWCSVMQCPVYGLC